MELNEDLRSKKISEKQDRIGTWLTVILLILCISLFFVKFVWLKCVQVDGPSMNNTLQNGDYLLIDRLNKVDRGEVVVFTFKEKSYIKRAVALGGDTVKIENKNLYVKKAGSENFELITYDGVKGKTYPKVYPSGEGKEFVVSDGFMYVLGDNREDSMDSRAFGEISLDCLDGVVTQFIIDNKDGFFGKFYRWL